MTNEQLKKLAEIAGIYPLDEVEVLGRTAFYAWVPTPFNQFVRSEWLPHVQIEQAMMVADSFDGYEIGKNMDAEFSYPQFFCQLGKVDIGMIAEGQGQTPAEAICAAAMATIGG